MHTCITVLNIVFQIFIPGALLPCKEGLGMCPNPPIGKDLSLTEGVVWGQDYLAIRHGSILHADFNLEKLHRQYKLLVRAEVIIT